MYWNTASDWIIWVVKKYSKGLYHKDYMPQNGPPPQTNKGEICLYVLFLLQFTKLRRPAYPQIFLWPNIFLLLRRPFSLPFWSLSFYLFSHLVREGILRQAYTHPWRKKLPFPSIYTYPNVYLRSIARIGNTVQVTLWLSVTNLQCHNLSFQFVRISQLCH